MINHLSVGFVIAALLAATSPSAAAPDGTLGMAIMSASVEGNGTLLRGSGVVSSTRISTGTYTVIFERSLTNCSCVASAGTSGGTSLYNRSVSATCPGSPDTAVHVGATFTTNVADAAFQVIVFCPR